MSFQLVIAEKPSVARSIAAVIGATEKQTGYWQGGGYLVSWCIGHLVSFAEADQYDEKYCKWRYEDLPILPQPWQFIVPDEKKQQFEIVRALLNRSDVDSVTAATDAGREGELIFRFVYQMAGCTKPVKRLWISSMEDAAIREASQTCARIRTTMRYTNRPSAAQRQIGWWASMQRGCFRCCTTRP